VRCGLGNALHALPRERDDLPERVAPGAGDDFDGMEQAILSHPPDRRSADTEQLRCPLLSNEQPFIAPGCRGGHFCLPIDEPLNRVTLCARQRCVSREHGLKNGAAGRVHGI